jgi:hypothetical protein
MGGPGPVARLAREKRAAVVHGSMHAAMHWSLVFFIISVQKAHPIPHTVQLLLHYTWAGRYHYRYQPTGYHQLGLLLSFSLL